MNHRSALSALFSVMVALVAMAWAPMAQAQAQADDFPKRPIRLLLGFPPGGGSDLVARLIAQPLGERLGQPVVVDNKPGAGGAIAADMAAKATADGYTIILLPSGHSSVAALKRNLPFHPVRDFAWISTLTTYPLALSVTPNSSIKSFADFIQRSKAEPGKFTYSSSGIGTAPHLIGEWILWEAGISAVHVPFKGGTGPVTELLAGRVDVMIDTMTLTASMLKDQRIRVLATTAPRGMSPLPGVPTVSDTLPQMVFESWLGIAAPAATPKPILDKLNREIRAVLELPEVRQKLSDFGGAARPSTPAEFQARVERDIDSLRKVAQERKIEAE
jgi:tripartite-type tricarboxylate transporter receptor subunit TctC